MSVRRPFVLAAALAIHLIGPAGGAPPNAEELRQARRWADEHFRQAAPRQGSRPAASARPGLVVLTNYGPVQQNARDGQPLKIADQKFTRGLYCHAFSEIRVRLPGPGKSFTATVGIDTNGNFGGGSAQFMIHVGGKRVFCSPVMHRGEPGVRAAADLGGAAEFTISVGCAGDNINSDQASWADAKAILTDGREIWLGDLPLVPMEVRRRQGAALPFSFVYGDQHSDELLATWKFREETRPPGPGKTQRTQTYFGDYYPLTAYGTQNAIWMAWQFDRPDLGQGFVQSFRRGDCPEESVRLRLRGLDPGAVYTLVDVDANQPWQATGQALLAQGVTVTSPVRPSAILITYHKKTTSQDPERKRHDP